ncbi:unnamed protein product, partial [Durusdinium trenchii]
MATQPQPQPYDRIDASALAVYPENPLDLPPEHLKASYGDETPALAIVPELAGALGQGAARNSHKGVKATASKEAPLQPSAGPTPADALAAFRCPSAPAAAPALPLLDAIGTTPAQAEASAGPVEAQTNDKEPGEEKSLEDYEAETYAFLQNKKLMKRPAAAQAKAKGKAKAKAQTKGK